MVEESTDEMLNKMQEEILRQKKNYEEDKSNKVLVFENKKREEIRKINEKIDLLKHKFETLENNREYEHKQKMNILNQEFSKLKAIIPIADFTDKVIMALS